MYYFHHNTLKALGEIAGAAGLSHPNQLRPHHIVRRVSVNEVALVSALVPYLQPGELLQHCPQHRVYQLFWKMSQAESFDPVITPAEVKKTVPAVD